MCTSMLSSSIYRKHSTARRNRPCAKQQSKVRAVQSATKQASRQSWRELVRRRAYTQLAAFSKRRKKSKSARQKYATTHKSAEAGVMREGPTFISNLNETQHGSFSPSFLCISYEYMHAASGLFSWSMELLNFASRHFVSKIVDLSVQFIRVLFYIFFLVSQRSGVEEGIQPLAFIRQKKGKKSGYTIKKSRGSRIGTTATAPAGPVLYLEVSLVATISLSLDSCSILIRVSKICLSIEKKKKNNGFFSLLEVSVVATISPTVVLTDRRFAFDFREPFSTIFSIVFFVFYVQVCVVAAISLSFDRWPILILVSKIHFSTFFRIWLS